jgi:hypothetical protein
MRRVEWPVVVGWLIPVLAGWGLVALLAAWLLR